MMPRCLICGFLAKDKLCTTHSKLYMWDSTIGGFRLKKSTCGSRYTQSDYHKNEIKLTKLLESYYGKNNVITSFRPIWAMSTKWVLYEYDIYIKNKDILIEYNGQQHYEYTPFFHKTKMEFLNQVKRDTRKARLAKKNGKKLIVFKYDEPLFEDYVINKIEGELHGLINASRK